MKRGAILGVALAALVVMSSGGIAAAATKCTMVFSNDKRILLNEKTILMQKIDKQSDRIQLIEDKIKNLEQAAALNQDARDALAPAIKQQREELKTAKEQLADLEACLDAAEQAYHKLSSK